MSWDSVDEAFKRLRSQEPKHFGNYLGFYSSVLGGYFREPWAMTLPLDDHGFHRGDAVFEAARIFDRAYIDLDAHLARLERSAKAIDLKLPKSLAEIKEVCVELAKRAGADYAAIRLYVTRGPGGFSPNPVEVIGSQLYVAITKLKLPPDEAYQTGVSAMFSTVSAKEAFWARIKSCNYLQNVMMKKEAIEKNFDFAISIDGEGRLCEGATENLLVLSEAGEILVPKFDYTLHGTTVSVVMDIARELVRSKQITGVRLADVRKEDLLRAREAAFVGTTLGVLPITRVEKNPVGAGKVGPVTTFLHAQLMKRMSTDSSLRTSF